MTKSFKSETRYRENWAVTIYTTPERSGFYTKCVSPTGKVFSTEICTQKGSAWQQGYKLVDDAIRKETTRRYNAIALPLTLALLYVSGRDEYYQGYSENPEFRGRHAWKGYDFDILDLLENQGLIEKQNNRRHTKSVYLTTKGIKQARNLLRNLNLEVEEFLQAHAEHENLSDQPQYIERRSNPKNSD